MLCTLGCNTRAVARGLCGKHYQRWSKYGDASIEVRSQAPNNSSAKERLIFTGWEIVNRFAPYADGPCWEWKGSTNRKGYGVCGSKLAYNLAWEVWKNVPVPDGHVIRHSCDNPLCICPDHLSLGTLADNAKDAAERGKLNRKIWPPEIKKILHEFESGVSQSDLSRKYGRTLGAINDLVLRKKWATVDPRKTRLLAIDTPSEKAVSSMGWALLEYGEDTPAEFIRYGAVTGGFEAAAEWFSRYPYMWKSPDIVVVEHYVAYNRNGDPTPLLAEGVVRYLRPDAVLQRSSGKNTLVPDDKLKALGLWSTEGHHHDEREAIRHALVYLVKSRHLPTLRLVHNR